MNTTTIHRMIRVFTGYGAPDIKDDVGPNKADWPFFNKVAHQDEMQDYQLLEAAERFHKYRNTQLPSIMRDAGLISKANQVESYLDKMKVRGTQAKREYEAQQAIISERNRAQAQARLMVTMRLTHRDEPIDDETMEAAKHEQVRELTTTAPDVRELVYGCAYLDTPHGRPVLGTAAEVAALEGATMATETGPARASDVPTKFL